MKNLFDQEVNNEIIERINQLTPESPAEWGRMSVSQMLAHAQVAMKAAFGEIQTQRSFFGILFGSFAKKQFVTSGKPFKKNLPTGKEFIIKDHPEFYKQRDLLIEKTRRLAEEGHSVMKVKVHPFFGKMTPEEWGQLQYSHMDHHLRQFGV